MAAYNVSAYQSGKLKTVDIVHLCSLSDGAVPYIEELALTGKDDFIAQYARQHLASRGQRIDDFRDWNIASEKADYITDKWD